MANILSLCFVCSCIAFAFAGVIFGAQEESLHFTFPPSMNFSQKGIATYGFLPWVGWNFTNTNNFMQRSNRDITQVTFSWMTYNQSISLWDDNSNFLTNFSSHFQFIISKNDAHSSQYGDGLAFFLALFDSEPPLNYTGQWLGLFNQSTDGSSSNQIVAVEFDTFKNDPFDPDDNHVGIDVNSIVSKANVSLKNKVGIKIRSGDLVDAWVDYDGLAKRLHVFLAAYSVGLQKPETPILSYDIDDRPHKVSSPENQGIG